MGSSSLKSRSPMALSCCLVGVSAGSASSAGRASPPRTPRLMPGCCDDVGVVGDVMLVVAGDVMLVVAGDVILVWSPLLSCKLVVLAACPETPGECPPQACAQRCLLWQQSHGSSVDSTSMICLVLSPVSYGTVGVLHSRHTSPSLIPEIITPQGMHCTSPSWVDSSRAPCLCLCFPPFLRRDCLVPSWGCGGGGVCG